MLCERNPGVSEENHSKGTTVDKLLTEILKEGLQNARQECYPFD
jgi:hypothetical protein